MSFFISAAGAKPAKSFTLLNMGLHILFSLLSFSILPAQAGYFGFQSQQTFGALVKIERPFVVTDSYETYALANLNGYHTTRLCSEILEQPEEHFIGIHSDRYALESSSPPALLAYYDQDTGALASVNPDQFYAMNTLYCIFKKVDPQSFSGQYIDQGDRFLIQSPKLRFADGYHAIAKKVYPESGLDAGDLCVLFGGQMQSGQVEFSPGHAGTQMLDFEMKVNNDGLLRFLDGSDGQHSFVSHELSSEEYGEPLELSSIKCLKN